MTRHALEVDLDTDPATGRATGLRVRSHNGWTTYTIGDLAARTLHDRLRASFAHRPGQRPAARRAPDRPQPSSRSTIDGTGNW